MKITRDPGAAYKFWTRQQGVMSITFSQKRRQNQVQVGEPIHSFIH